MAFDGTKPSRSEAPEAGATPVRADGAWTVRVPASRGRALTRGILWLAPTSLLFVATATLYSSLDFARKGGAIPIVAYSAALIGLPLPLAGLWCAIRAGRWLGLALWPGWVGFVADGRGLELRLGPFGSRFFDLGRLDVRYLFELSADLEEEGFEAFLPEEQQIARFVPRIMHPLSRERINQTIIRFAVADEAAVARMLRPAIKRWRGNDEPAGAAAE